MTPKETPNELAERYFAAMRARDSATLQSLFSSDATIAFPDGREIAGQGAISEWFTGLFKAAPPTPNVVALIASADSIATENEVSLPNGSVRRTANFFHLDESGRIRRLSVYARTGT